MVFKIDLKIFIFLILLYLTKQINIYWIMMLFALLHELGHLFAGIMLKMKVKKMAIMPAGFSVEFSLKENDYNQKILNSNLLEVKKIIVALAGPITNILVIIIIKLINIQNNITYNIIYANCLIALFNLLPIYPLDGGRILKSIICLKLNRKKAIIYVNRISNLILFIITFLTSILIYYWKNWLILVILAYLWYITLKENKVSKMKMKLYEALEKL